MTWKSKYPTSPTLRVFKATISEGKIKGNYIFNFTLYLFLFTFAFWEIEVPPSIIACQSVATFESIPCIALIPSCSAVPVITTDLGSVNYIARRLAEIYKIKIEMIRWVDSEYLLCNEFGIGLPRSSIQMLEPLGKVFLHQLNITWSAHFRKKEDGLQVLLDQARLVSSL